MIVIYYLNELRQPSGDIQMRSLSKLGVFLNQNTLWGFIAISSYRAHTLQ